MKEEGCHFAEKRQSLFLTGKEIIWSCTT